ncbi:MAG: hypothetical protein R3C70_12440 [Geminicoccaceae bacterium]
MAFAVDENGQQVRLRAAGALCVGAGRCGMPKGSIVVVAFRANFSVLFRILSIETLDKSNFLRFQVVQLASAVRISS